MSRGGFRVGSGRPRKALEEKILDGTIEKDYISEDTQLVEIVEKNMPAVKDYMVRQQASGNVLNSKEELEDIAEWVDRNGCLKYVPHQLLEQYAMNRARWIDLQDKISQYQYMAKKGNGNPMVSPFYEMLSEEERKMNSTFNSINQIVKEHCASYQPFAPRDSVMASILDS